MDTNIQHLQDKYNSYSAFHKFLSNEYGLLFLDDTISGKHKIYANPKHSNKQSTNQEQSTSGVHLRFTKTHTTISAGSDPVSKYNLPTFLDLPIVNQDNVINITHLLTESEIESLESKGDLTVICDYTNPYNMGYITSIQKDASVEKTSNIPGTLTLKDKLIYVYSEYIKKLQFAIRKLQFIDSLVQYVMYGKKKVYKIQTYIHSIIMNNVEKCIEFCRQHSLKYNPYYDRLLPNNLFSIIKKSFISLSSNPHLLNHVQLYKDSIFSLTTKETAEVIVDIIKTKFKTHTLIDGTANVGSATIIFSQHFANIHAVELMSETFKVLCHNFECYSSSLTTKDKLETINKGHKNAEYILNWEHPSHIQLYNEDIIEFMKTQSKINLENTCLFLDPPWGGVFYSCYESISLYLSNINISQFIETLKVPFIIIKVPKNYKVSDLDNITNYKWEVLNTWNSHEIKGINLIIFNKV